MSSIAERLHAYSMAVQKVRLRSSTIRNVRYEARTCSLDVEFVKRVTYRYFDVPPEVVEGLLRADSHGRYLNRHIKGRYRYEVID